MQLIGIFNGEQTVKDERKLFGTDGIRGTANIYPMTADVALKLGQATGIILKKRFEHTKDERIKVIIGKDTRKSCYIFEYALTAGLCSMGIDVYQVGPMPTPAIAHLTKSFAADTGIVISASHNYAEDNGIKFFDSKGLKLSDDIELEIEKIVINNHIETAGINGLETGKAFKIEDARGRYIEFAKSTIGNISLKGLTVVLDCANGAAYNVGPKIFRELGADVFVYNHNPDGVNINKNCGALYPDNLKELVLSHRADVAIALDGDADRVIMVDEKGEILDGDMIVAINALDMKKKGKLAKDTVCTTVMSNLGFEKALEKKGIKLVRTKVGDRYVTEEMRKNGFNLGGEQSGHIVFSDYSTTGDGTISALQILRVMKERKAKLSELNNLYEPYPQILENVMVKEKKDLSLIKGYDELIEEKEKELAGKGRILIRYSGTENKCRVMVEGEDEILIDLVSKDLVEFIKKNIGV